jgi:hypothetical protein
MNTDKIDIFRAKREFVALHRFVLNLVQELRLEHDANIEKVGESLVDMEEFISTKYGIDVDLGHLTRHFTFLDDSKFAFIRNKILDFSNNCQRSLN